MNLVEVEKEAVKEDDRAVLLEGGGLQSASPKARTLSAWSPIFRFLNYGHCTSFQFKILIPCAYDYYIGVGSF